MTVPGPPAMPAQQGRKPRVLVCVDCRAAPTLNSSQITTRFVGNPGLSPRRHPTRVASGATSGVTAVLLSKTSGLLRVMSVPRFEHRQSQGSPVFESRNTYSATERPRRNKCVASSRNQFLAHYPECATAGKAEKPTTRLDSRFACGCRNPRRARPGAAALLETGRVRIDRSNAP